MAIYGSINKKKSIRASVSRRKTISGSAESTANPDVIDITVVGSPGSYAGKIVDLQDVDINGGTNNSILKYNASTEQWYATNQLPGLEFDEATGSPVIDGGDF